MRASGGGGARSHGCHFWSVGAAEAVVVVVEVVDVVVVVEGAGWRAAESAAVRAARNASTSAPSVSRELHRREPTTQSSKRKGNV